jgi:hypothetical protein
MLGDNYGRPDFDGGKSFKKLNGTKGENTYA